MTDKERLMILIGDERRRTMMMRRNRYDGMVHSTWGSGREPSAPSRAPLLNVVVVAKPLSILLSRFPLATPAAQLPQFFERHGSARGQKVFWASEDFNNSHERI